MRSLNLMLRLMRMPTLMICVLALTACGGSTPSAEGPILLQPVPNEYRRRYRPIELPDRAITKAETQKFWSRDRGTILMCDAGTVDLINYPDALAKEFNAAVQ